VWWASPQADGRLSVQFSTKIDFYRFKWTFDCAPLTGEEQRIAFLRTSFLQPLLVITGELQQQLRELKNIIALKGIPILTTTPNHEVNDLLWCLTLTTYAFTHTFFAGQTRRSPSTGPKALSCPKVLHALLRSLSLCGGGVEVVLCGSTSTHKTRGSCADGALQSGGV
jgi:hypothetical protein